MTMMPPANLPTEAPTARSRTATACTWQELAGHWLQNAHVVRDESESQTRRMAAVRRWRGLSGPPLGTDA